MENRIIILIFILFPIFAFAQQDTSLNVKTSTVIYNNRQIAYGGLELFYGGGIPTYKDINSIFNNTGNINASIFIYLRGVDRYIPKGGMKLNDFIKFSIDFDYYNNSISLLSSQNEKINSKIISIRPDITYSLGFEFEKFKIIPYVNIPLVDFFNSMNFVSYSSSQDNDSKKLDVFTENIKSGYTRNNGIIFGINDSYTINIGYKHTLIYPKHLVMKDIGSWAIDATSHLISSFISLMFFDTKKNTLTNNIGYGVMTYILQNTASVMFQYLRKTKGMNWPFTSEKPLSIETIRIGAGIIF
jgi:hypothetical protein